MRLKELRLNSDLTQEEFGSIIGQTKSNISKYENGVLEPNIDTLKKMANYFNVTLDYLTGNSNNPSLTQKEEINIQLELKNMRQKLEEGTLQMNLDGEEIDEEIKQFILDNMEDTLTLAKIKAKEKFTPKKYRK